MLLKYSMGSQANICELPDWQEANLHQFAAAESTVQLEKLNICWSNYDVSEIAVWAFTLRIITVFYAYCIWMSNSWVIPMRIIPYHFKQNRMVKGPIFLFCVCCLCVVYCTVFVLLLLRPPCSSSTHWSLETTIVGTGTVQCTEPL